MRRWVCVIVLACALPASNLELGTTPQRPEVWASLTTTPSRADQIDLVLQSLLRQSFLPRTVTVRVTSEETLSIVNDRLGALGDAARAGNVDVRGELVEELGPATKYPLDDQSFGRVPDDAFVLIVDDDWAYSNRTIERLVACLEREPTGQHVSCGFFVRPRYGTAPGYNSSCGRFTSLRYPLGYASNGLLFRKQALSGFGEFHRRLMRVQPACTYVDDMSMSGFLHARGVTLRTAQRGAGDERPRDLGGGKRGALRKTHDRGCENEACMRAVLEWIKNGTKIAGSSGSHRAPRVAAGRPRPLPPIGSVG